MVKKLIVKSLVQLVFIFLLIFIISASFYFYLEAKTNISSLSASMNFIRDFVKGEVFESIQSYISRLDKLIFTQTMVFLISGLSLVFLVWHMFSLFTVQKEGALRDALTGLSNRRALFFGLKRELTRAERYKHPISIAMIDIDYFKQYNDLNGHPVGDRALQRMANLLKKGIRETDLVGRIGGEEFMIIFPETDTSKAKKVCEALRKRIEKADFVGEAKLPNKAFTVSIGIAGLEKGKGTRNRWQLISKADKQLYAAKKAGRNRVK